MSKPGLRIVTVLLVAFVLVMLAFSMLANSMSKDVGRDEQMYCAGGVLMSRGKMIYRDFSYAANLPCHPLLYAAVYRISGTSHYLLAGRMVSVVCDVLVMACIFGIYRRVFRSCGASGLVPAFAGVVLYVFNPLVDYANGYAWNHDVVILCVAASFWIFISVDFTGRLQWGRLAAIGALLTFASCMRITTVLVELVFLGVLLGRPAGSWKERYKRALPFLTAAAAVLVWPVWVVAQAPHAFFLNVFRIPTLYGQWLRQAGMVHDKFELATASLRTPGYFALIVIAVYLGLAVLFLRRRLEIRDGRSLLLGCLLVAAFFVIAWVPPTMWRQYLAVPAPFIVIGLAFPLAYLKKAAGDAMVDMHFKIAYGLMAVCASVAVLANPVVLMRIPLAFAPQEWTPVVKHNSAEELGRKVQEPKRVLTLAPLPALEAGCEIYDELSAGAIIYRAADMMKAQERALTHTVGPKGLKKLTDDSPPSAVLLGVEASYMAFLERPLAEVPGSDWPRHILPDGTVLYLRP